MSQGDRPTPASQPNRITWMRPISVSSHLEKEALMEILKGHADVFTVNPKAVVACRGPPMRLKLKDLNNSSYVASIRATIFLSNKR